MNGRYVDNQLLEQAIAAGDGDAIARSLYQLVDQVIARIPNHPPGFDLEDLRQRAVLSAWLRVPRFDPRFATAYSYFSHSIKLSYREAIRRHRRKPLRQLPEDWVERG